MADYSNPKASNAILGDLQEIVALIQSGAKMDPTGNTNIPNGAKRVVSVTGGYQIQSYNGTTWVSIGKLMHDCDSVDGKSPNTGTTANTIPVRNAQGALPGDITGNAATATKLATARTIDLGGILSATEQSFDGSGNVTIPVNSVNVNNDNDDAVVGVLTQAHGGTGRTDGAAADVVVSSAQGTVKASAYGQIGDAINKTGTDLDTLTVTGNYLFRGGTVENHFPWDIPEASLTLVEVFRAGVHIFQTLTYSSGQQWMRRSANTGGEWQAWTPVQGQYGQNAHISIYISKSGSDNNTGLDSAYPVLTINRALEVARGIVPSRGTYGVKFCIGEGDWGNVTIESMPFPLHIYPFDGVSASQFLNSLPTFTTFQALYSNIYIAGAVINGEVISSQNASITIQNYNRVATLEASYGGVIRVSGASYPLELCSMNGQQYSLRGYLDGVILFSGSRTLTVVENQNVKHGFFCFDRSGFCFGTDLVTVNTADGVTVTGRKYLLQRSSTAGATKAWLDALPGSEPGQINHGIRMTTGLWGGGDSHYLMGGDAIWRQDSSYIYARDVAVGGNTDDLASARGQIGQAPSLSATDWNTLTKSGTYWFTTNNATNSTNRPSTAGGHLVVYAQGNYVHQFYYQYNSHIAWHRCKNNTWGAWKQLLDANGNFPNNAATASKLYTARDITLTGQVTGSASFDGSGNTSMTTYNGAYASAVVEGEAQENSWFKIADTMDSGSYVSFNIRFLVQRATSGGASFVWTISCMLNNGATEVQSLKSYITDIINGPEADIPQDYFVATSFAGTNGRARVALWVNIPSRHSGYKFTVLGEASRGELDTTKWNLYHLEKEDGVTEIPSSYTSVTTQFFTPESSFAVGDFCWSYRSSKTGFLLCNGAAISRTTYADLYAIIGTKFGTGDGSTTFNLPDMRGKVAQGANGNLGTVLAAGLPNAVASTEIGAVLGGNTGAGFWGANSTSSVIRHGGSNIYDSGKLNLDLSRASSIYGKSTTVQPPAIALNCFIKY